MVLLVSSFGLRQPSHRHQTGNCRRGAHRIERSFRFRNFREALTFVQEVGELAESAAVEAGRWPTEVRPFTRNRQHALYKLR
jgi:hypothetical protein